MSYLDDDSNKESTIHNRKEQYDDIYRGTLNDSSSNSQLSEIFYTKEKDEFYEESPVKRFTLALLVAFSQTG